jgi:RyR domain-containing protein
MNSQQIAFVCHETNRAYCHSIGDDTQKPWEEAEEWQRESAIKGVWFAVNNPTAPASSQHDAWMKDKLEDGWTLGPVKDSTKKEHPCMVPYEQLPLEQRIKDHLFKAIVRAFVESGATSGAAA